MNAVVKAQERAPLTPSERAMARRLGLALAIVVAFGCDLVALAIRGSAELSSGGLPFLIVDLVAGLLPIVAAAPFGWLLGPTLARAHLPGKIGVAVVMSIFTMLLGDAVYVLGATSLSSILGGESAASLNAPGLVAFMAIAALVVGPFVVVLATLPAAVVWVCAFRLVWRSMDQAAPR